MAKRDDTMNSLPGPRRVRRRGVEKPEAAGDFIARVAAYAADELGVRTRSPADEARARAERRKARTEESAAAVGAVRNPGRKALKGLRGYDRSKPTEEQAGRGVYEIERAETFDTSRKGEKVLVNQATRAGGAAIMHRRGLLGVREVQAAERIVMLAELAGASQLSGVPLSERVDGGRIDLDGNRLRAAANASGEYRAAISKLSRRGRILVENVVVLGTPLEQAVRLRSLRLSENDAETTIRNRCNKAMPILRDALDHLADIFGLPE